MTTIRLTVDNQPISAQLADNPTAQDLSDQLPLTLTFHDLNHAEKIARLPRPLTTEGVPQGDDPDIADIGYYAPTNDLDFVKGQPDGFQVTINRG